MQDFIEGPFDQTIKTANFPVLASIVGLAYEGGTPFQAGVYFINIARIIQVKFAVPFFDVYDPRFADFGVPVAVRGTVKVICSHCGELIVDENYGHINGEIICSECIDRYCVTCERCGSLMWDSDSYGDDYTTLCRSCYENHYTRCYECDTLLYNDDSYEYDGEYYCRECYDNVCCGDSIL